MKATSWRERLLGKARDPLSPDTRHSLALAAFLAWVGLGADGLSSSSYGPEEAFRALGAHTHLALFLAIATAITVFVVALAYNQVIELFPTGGGGYRVSTALLGPTAGLVSGSALIVDYVLTIAISVASGTDALFSLLPASWQTFKLWTACVMVLLLIWLNLRGAKESIKVLLPIFAGFVVTHAILIAWGIFAHAEGLPLLIPDTIREVREFSQESGWFFVLAVFLKAYSLGGGTYTGIEAVSNNVDRLAEPVVHTGKATMLLMAISLAFTAGGIILLYLLWNAAPVEGQTLNAVVFGNVLGEMGFGGGNLVVALTVVLAFEAGLLFVAANTGFLGGPSVLSNMASDSWMPHRFRYLSNRLVTENGILLMGISAFAILLLTGGKVSVLVVLYSINVFLTFTLSLAGLSTFWIRNRHKPLHKKHWRQRLALSLVAVTITSSILVVTIVEKFFEGGWATLLITSVLIFICLGIRSHYRETRRRIAAIDDIFADQSFGSDCSPPALDPYAPTAAFLVGSSRGGGLHALLWVQRMFPDHFKNFIFINARTVDAQVYGGPEAMEAMKLQATTSLKFFERFCNSYGMAATSRLSFGTDAVQTLEKEITEVLQEYPNTIVFASKLVFKRENFVTRLLHNQAINSLQRRMHVNGQQLMVLPMLID
ncbi:MAG: amino acid transporter [Bordetella sp. SCN 67-23]|nr:APC family permease [Burkholderiales bacterium]ODS73706.1 MAG: amino acid transporter [Bordetella sp. SCN 67-23]OJW89925.1 MAG: amino acid transporter [Burkholderiales bacterium 67-32]